MHAGMPLPVWAKASLQLPCPHAAQGLGRHLQEGGDVLQRRAFGRFGKQFQEFLVAVVRGLEAEHVGFYLRFDEGMLQHPLVEEGYFRPLPC